MSGQQGRGGMGSHKHGVSGHCGPNGRTTKATARMLNREQEQRAKLKAAHRQEFTGSVRDLLTPNRKTKA